MIVCSTSINSPTKQFLGLLGKAKKKNWKIILAGDLKTPHLEYQKLECDNFQYLTPEWQDKEYPKLSAIVGWRSIQRRNLSFVAAYKENGPIIATYDDDQYIYDNYGENILVGKEVEVDIWNNVSVNEFEPYSITNNPHIWQRGFVLEFIKHRHNNEYQGKKKRKVLFENSLVDGDSDLDCITRISQSPIVKFNNIDPYSSEQLSPVNSQNSFFAREILPYYSVWIASDRLDDIFSGLWLQQQLNIRPVYTSATVFQERTPQDLITNLEKEVVGMRYGKRFLESGCDPTILPNGEKIKEFIKIYQDSF